MTNFTKDSYPVWDVALSIAIFMMASSGMSICNKLAVSALPVECSVVLIQMAFTVLFLVPNFFRADGKDKEGKPTKAIELGEWIDFLWFAPAPVFLFAGMLLSSMYAYSYNTVAVRKISEQNDDRINVTALLCCSPLICLLASQTIVVFRNLSPLFAMAAELLQAKPLDINIIMVLALCMAVVGCVIFGHGNIQLSTMGLVTVMLNLFIATTERVVVRWVMKKEVTGSDGVQRQLKINDAGMMFYYNGLGKKWIHRHRFL